MVILMLRVIILTPDQFYVKGLTGKILGFLKNKDITLSYFYPINVNFDNIHVIYPNITTSHCPVSMYSLSASLVLIVNIPDGLDLTQLKGLSRYYNMETLRGLSAQTRKSFSVVHTFDKLEEDEQFIASTLGVKLSELSVRNINYNDTLVLLPVYNLSDKTKFRALKTLNLMIAALKQGLGPELIANSMKIRIWLDEIAHLASLLAVGKEPQQVFGLLEQLRSLSLPLSSVHAHICALERLTGEG